jgi:hypothetical protein
VSKTILSELIETTKLHNELDDSKTIKLIMNENKILHSNTLPGVDVDAKETNTGIDVKVVVNEGVKVEKPVHFCFGVLHNSFEQNINIDILVKENAKISVVGHCIFMGKQRIIHNMEGNIELKDDAEFSYFERHIHSESGNVEVYPKAKIKVGKNSRYKTEFELLKGKVGITKFDYNVEADDYAVVEMEARMSGKSEDKITIKESANLFGKHSKAVLKSNVAVRNKASAIVYNSLTASGDSAKGHVDCTEILQDQGTVQAFPNVQVLHPKAHVTHEASLGGVDNKQLETLMARGMSEEEAEEMIINGLLS